MPTIRITGRAGGVRVVEFHPGGSLMETIGANGFDDLLALCGTAGSRLSCQISLAAAMDGLSVTIAPED